MINAGCRKSLNSVLELKSLVLVLVLEFRVLPEQNFCMSKDANNKAYRYSLNHSKKTSCANQHPLLLQSMIEYQTINK